MKKTFKRLLFIISFIVFMGSSIRAEVKIPIYFNGTEVTTSNSPYLTPTNRVMIPYEDVAVPLNIKLQLKGDTLISTGQNVKTCECITAKFNVDSNTIEINGKPTEVDNSIEMKEGVIYLPLRLISELYGYKVTWTGTSVEIKCP